MSPVRSCCTWDSMVKARDFERRRLWLAEMRSEAKSKTGCFWSRLHQLNIDCDICDSSGWGWPESNTAMISLLAQGIRKSQTSSGQMDVSQYLP